MKAYFKPVGDDEWQELGDVKEKTLSIEDPTPHYETTEPRKASISFTLPAEALSKELRRSMFRKYPKLPRKLKKEIKSFRKLLGLPYKKCSRLELIKTYCLVWRCGYEYNVNPSWLTRAGWKIGKEGES